MIDLRRLPKVMNPGQVAEYLRVCTRSVDRWCLDGKIKFHRIGKRGDKRITAKNLNEYLFELN